MKKSILLFVLFLSVAGFSQSVNDYQYVIVPKRFSLFKEADRYRLNTTTKLLLEKYGFKVFVSDVTPVEIGNSCDALYADVIEDKAFLVTKLKIVLKDCRGNIVYETDYGKSKEKDYALAYNGALRDTAKSFDQLSYKYNGTKSTGTSEKLENNVPSITTADVVVPASTQTNVAGDFYFAQPTATGFQVVDNEPKVILRLFNTSQKNFFIAEKGTRKGVVFPKNGQWVFEYYDNSKLVSEPINLKF